jgi:hypothetical protein
MGGPSPATGLGPPNLSLAEKTANLKIVRIVGSPQLVATAMGGSPHVGMVAQSMLMNRMEWNAQRKMARGINQQAEEVGSY